MSSKMPFPGDQVRLRPHHLLCLQNYQGKGYDEAFVRNMNGIVGRLSESPDTWVRLVSGGDDVCACCPNYTEQCRSEKKVLRFDRNARDMFDLEEDLYRWEELCRIVRTDLTPEKMKQICGGCEWAENGTCPHL